jgi:PKD repeat protein
MRTFRRSDPAEDRARAQLILVSALVLATTLVALSLVVNSVIYTENLATRRDADTGQALNFREATHDGGVRALEAANFDPADATFLERKTTLRDALAAWETSSSRYFARRGLDVGTSAASFVEGTRVSHDVVGTFDPATDDVLYENKALDPLGVGAHDTWLAVYDADVRRLRMDVERDGPLYESSADPMSMAIDTLYDGNDVYSLNIEDADGDRWWIVVYEDTTSLPSQVGVATYEIEDDESFLGGDWTTSDPCLVDADTVTLDVTGGTVQGDGGPVECPALGFWAKDSFAGPISVEHTEGDQISGTYSFVADDPEGTFRSDIESENNGDLYSDIEDYHTNVLGQPAPTVSEDDTYVSSPGSGAPYTNPAIYATDVTVSYRTGGVDYQSSVRLAPGEPGEETTTSSGAGGAGGGGGGGDDNAAPDAQFSVSPTSTTVGNAVSFDASTSSDADGSVQSYEWSYDDGNVDTGTTVSHSFASAGTYDVTLTVTDDDGATDSRTRTVEVVSSSAEAPTIDSLSTSDGSSDGKGGGNSPDDISFTADWTVSDDDGNLAQVRVEMVGSPDSSPTTLDTDSATVVGSSADSALNVGSSVNGGCGEPYDIVVTVEDGDTQTNTRTERVIASC